MSQLDPAVLPRSFVQGAIDGGTPDERGLAAALLDTAPCLVVILDRTGGIIRFNRVCCDVTGYAFEETRNRKVWDFLLPPEQIESVKAVFENLIGEATGAVDPGRYPHTYENEWVTKTGARRLILWSNATLRGDDGRILAVMGTGLDITERRRAEEALRASEKRYRVLVDHASVCIKELDREGRITSINPAGVAMLGAGSAAQLVGRHFLDCVSTAERARIDDLVDRAFRGESSDVEFGVSCFQKDLTLASTLIPIRGPDGLVEKVMGITQDITERKRTHARLVQQESLVKLGEMAAVVAHEVRNPLAGIRGSLEVIGPRLPAGSRARTEVETLVHRVDALNEMVDDLLSFARPQPPVVAPVSLHTVLQSAIEALKQDGHAKHVTVEVSGESPLVRADGEQLSRVFLNLLLNGVQAMEAGGQIRVWSRVRGDRCSVDICDAGRGIPAELGDKVFEPFVTTRHRGTGLGLPIAKRTLEAHGGDLRVVATGERGTTVRVTLPLDGSQAIRPG